MSRASEALSFPATPHSQSLGPVPVEVKTNPSAPAKISIDGKAFTVPATVGLSPGQHQFSAISEISDMFVTYGFDRWQVNGVTVSYMQTTLITITGPSTVIAQYMLIETGLNSPPEPNSLPNPKGPMTPNLILDNPTVLGNKPVKEV